MASKVSKKEAEGGAALIIAILLLPFLIVTIIHYFRLKSRLLSEPSSRRIIDVRRAMHRVWIGGSALGLALVGSLYVFAFSGSGRAGLNPLSIIVLIAAGIIVIAIGILTARALAAGLVGVVFNPANQTISFPTDGILRSFSDAKTVVSAIVPASVETLSLRDIHGLTRQGGTSLLLQGEFGSRAITFSDKLRRDECLMLLSKGRRFADFEQAGQGDYA